MDSLESTVIITPDQRLRVFVSSTLQELSEERKAAKAAIEALRLTPVMFELGARAHPPRALYRAYLEQSQIFVGIYWQRYGWVAPGEEISGLEDEYRLSGERPKLIYVKTPAPEREERLKGLLGQVQRDDQLSYKPFSSAQELQELLRDDLALLLTERFEQARARAARAPVSLPAAPSPIVGRERELAAVQELFAAGARLVTLSGPGGIGKTRLALELAWHAAAEGKDVAFVPLAALNEPAQVVRSIARVLDVRSQPDEELEALERVLRERELLLVLDNFEQVLEAAPQLSRLLAAAPGLRLLVTSRALLRLVGEHEFPVPPLALPRAGSSELESVRRSEAVKLFLARAQSVRPEFKLTLENALAVAEICHQLDGLPLAIELAAARVKLFTPAQLLARLGDRLGFLRSDARDLPERQRTLRSTIDWSYSLLSPAEQRLFAIMGLFVGGASLETIEELCGGACGDLLDTLGSLVDKSLVEQREQDGEVRFTMLEMIRAYAAEKLGLLPEADALRERHARSFLALAERGALAEREVPQQRWFARLERERGNFRAAFEHALARGDVSTVARLGWALWDFWWVRGYQKRGREWLDRALEASEKLSPVERARALYVAGAMAFIQGDFAAAETRCRDCLDAARASGDQISEALAYSGLGLVALFGQAFDDAETYLLASLEAFGRAGQGSWGAAHVQHFLWRLSAFRGDPVGAADKLAESARLFREVGDDSALVLVLHNLALVALLRGDLARARTILREALDLALALNNRWYTAYCLEGFGSLAALEQDGERAARLFGAADALRSAINAPQTPFDQALYQDFVLGARALSGAEHYAEAFAAGRQQGLEASFALLERLPQAA